MQVQRKVIGQSLPAITKHLGDQRPVAFTETHGVVRQIRALAAQAEIHHEQRHAEALLAQPLGFLAAPRMPTHQVAVGVHHIGVRRHGVEGKRDAAFAAHTDHAVVFDDDGVGGLAQLQRAAHRLEQRAHRLN